MYCKLYDSIKYANILLKQVKAYYFKNTILPASFVMNYSLYCLLYYILYCVLYCTLYFTLFLKHIDWFNVHRTVHYLWTLLYTVQ